jgi:F0F1-type ATP synthase delta subunit
MMNKKVHEKLRIQNKFKLLVIFAVIQTKPNKIFHFLTLIISIWKVYNNFEQLLEQNSQPKKKKHKKFRRFFSIIACNRYESICCSDV